MHYRKEIAKICSLYIRFCMKNIAASFDWNQARAFLVTAEHGSLSAAARALSLSQPTLSRQVSGLEEDLGILLFERVGRTLVLTQAGLDLLDHFRTMGSAAEQISMTASGKSESVEGQVSITASDVLSAHFLPEFLKVLRDRAPGITVEIVASDDIRDLKRREADIAIRHVRPEQPDLIAKLLAESAARFYAASDYLERYGRPASVADLAGALFVGYGDPARLLPHLAHLNLPLTEANFRYVSESGVTGWEMVRQGLGIGIMSTALGGRTPGVEPVLPDLIPKITFPTWLVAHRELHTNRRIRLVFDLLSDHLKM